MKALTIPSVSRSDMCPRSDMSLRTCQSSVLLTYTSHKQWLHSKQIVYNLLLLVCSNKLKKYEKKQLTSQHWDEQVLLAKISPVLLSTEHLPLHFPVGSSSKPQYDLFSCVYLYRLHHMFLENKLHIKFTLNKSDQSYKKSSQMAELQIRLRCTEQLHKTEEKSSKK